METHGYRSGHKKLERKLGSYGNNYHQPPQRRLSGGCGGSNAGPRGGSGHGNKQHGDLAKRYTGASLVKAPKDGVSELQKRALDLTGAPLINYNSYDSHHIKEKVYRTQSATCHLTDRHDSCAAADSNVTLAQLQQQMLFLRQLQAAHQQQQQQHLTQFPRYDVYDSGHGSLDGSSCGGSDHDLRSASAGSAEAEGASSSGGLRGGELQCQAIHKRPLEAANSMPILTIQPDCHDEDLDFGDVEIEVEDERKYLPTDLFIDQHDKLCSTKSHNGNWTTGKWEDESGSCHASNVASANGSMAVRKTTSLNPEGFNLFSDQLDLLSSVRSNWNKNSSCGSSEDGASGSTGFEDSSLGSTGFEDTALGSTGFESGFEDKQKDFESAMENLTQEMGSILLRKI